MLSSRFKKTGAALLLASGLALPIAKANAQPDQRDGRRGPPAEAIEVCAGQSEGDVCDFSTPRGDMEGTCRTTARRRTTGVCP